MSETAVSYCEPQIGSRAIFDEGDTNNLTYAWVKDRFFSSRGASRIARRKKADTLKSYDREQWAKHLQGLKIVSEAHMRPKQSVQKEEYEKSKYAVTDLVFLHYEHVVCQSHLRDDDPVKARLSAWNKTLVNNYDRVANLAGLGVRHEHRETMRTAFSRLLDHCSTISTAHVSSNPCSPRPESLDKRELIPLNCETFSRQTLSPGSGEGYPRFSRPLMPAGVSVQASGQQISPHTVLQDSHSSAKRPLPTFPPPPAQELKPHLLERLGFRKKGGNDWCQ